MPKVGAWPFMSQRMVEAALGVKVPSRVIAPSLPGIAAATDLTQA
jgi:hypothetical protein